MKSTCIALLLSFLLVSSSHAVVVLHNETADGDLSDEGSTATPVGTLSITMTNEVIGTMGGSPVDADIFTFTVPNGATLTSIDLTLITSSGGPGSLGGGSFMTAGPGTTLDTGNPGIAFDGSEGAFGSVLIDAPATVFTASLPAGPGEYSIWFQETIGEEVSYTIRLTAVPEPSSALCLAFTSLLAIAALRRK